MHVFGSRLERQEPKLQFSTSVGLSAFSVVSPLVIAPWKGRLGNPTCLMVNPYRRERQPAAFVWDHRHESVLGNKRQASPLQQTEENVMGMYSEAE